MMINPIMGRLSPFVVTDRNEYLEQDKVPSDQESKDGKCVGSSHGWLIFVKNEQTVYMLHPILRSRRQLPKRGLPADPKSITKAVLSCDPEYNNKDYTVAIIHGFESKHLAYFVKGGTERRWIDLNVRQVCDIIFHRNRLYALDERCTIGVWDFSDQQPLPFFEIRTSFPPGAFQSWEPIRDKCTGRLYLVCSSGHLLLVSRLVGDYVRDGVPIYESDLVEIGSNCPPIHPYRTLDFKVHRVKMEDWSDEWEVVDSLGDQVIFVGGNHSVCVPHDPSINSLCARNSIYFTDDYWERVNEDPEYGGHDLGRFDMADRRIHEFYERDKIEPPPFWVFPGFCYDL